MNRFHGPIPSSPLAERLWFVKERGMAGWIDQQHRLWAQSAFGCWRLFDHRQLAPNAWVMPFLQFPRRLWQFEDHDGQHLQPYVVCAARFPDTPPQHDAPPVWLARPAATTDTTDGEVPF